MTDTGQGAWDDSSLPGAGARVTRNVPNRKSGSRGRLEPADAPQSRDQEVGEERRPAPG